VLTVRAIRRQAGRFRWACVLGACGAVALGTARAQSVNPQTVPTPLAPNAAALPSEATQSAPWQVTPAAAPQPQGGTALAGPQAAPAAAAGQPASPEPVSLDHPKVVDTATLATSANSVTLFGIVGLTGEAAQGLQTFLATTNNRMICQPKTGTDFVCLLPDGTDLAEVALVNGAARARDDAPAAYHEQEAAAQAARRGIWASLPPPPVVLTHPVVRNTATVVADGHAYALDGLQGLGAPYTGQLQGYVAANGDTLSCQPQPASGRYVCVLGDGTDIAKVALVNGAARVTADAPDAYRLQQHEALTNQRGYWLHPPQDAVVAATTVVVQPSACCAFVPGDDGSDGIAYVGGVPTAVIAGETVFLVYAGVAGWGYYDHWHRWNGAPYGYGSHMERYHPGGYGLRGNSYGPPGQHGGMPPGGVHTMGTAAVPGHGAMTPGRSPGSTGGGFVRPASAGPGSGFHSGATAAPAIHSMGGGAPHMGGGTPHVATPTAATAHRGGGGDTRHHP
jgi:endonuclease YncB( thermonuclease family)